MRRFMVCAPYQIRVVISKMRWARHVARMEEKINARKVLVRKPEVKRQLGKTARRWKHIIKKDFKEIKSESEK
jgi:hypothetical protein